MASAANCVELITVLCPSFLTLLLLSSTVAESTNKLNFHPFKTMYSALTPNDRLFCLDLSSTDNLIYVYPVVTHQNLPA